MTTRRTMQLVSLAASALLCACGGGGVTASDAGGGTGGLVGGTGGTKVGSGGASTGTGGASVGSGGATTSSGGASMTGGAIGTAGVTGSGGRASGTGGRGTGGASTGGAVGTGGAAGAGGSGGMSTGAAGAVGAADVCARWKADRADLSEGTWNGTVAGCMAGDLGAVPRANALRLVNLYRWFAGLPAVVTDPALDAKDQQCALMQRANNSLSHSPPTTWTCYTQDGADAAGNSNISSGLAVSSVDGYMVDSGNATTIGHRRWILSNSLGPIGIGGTDKASCMWTLGGKGKAGKAWTAWPAPGIIPLQAFSDSWGGNLDSTGWSIQSDTINLAAAVVAVTVDGVAQPVAVVQLDANYGGKYALRFTPTGWKTAAGKTYAVSVTGISTPISYQVQVVSCN